MPITQADVEKIAVLARLDLSDQEIGQYTEQLGSIVSFVEQLSAVPTEGIEPMSHPLDVHTVVREDLPQASLPRESALLNSPNHDAECFLVPPVMVRKS